MSNKRLWNIDVRVEIIALGQEYYSMIYISYLTTSYLTHTISLKTMKAH